MISVDDSEHGLLSHQYQPGESDIRLQLDDRTRPETSHQSKVGGHNQSQSQLHYTRMSGSPWQAVVWDAAQAKLLVASPETLNSADGGYQSSKQRRRLYNAIALNQWSQHSFDKASNSFFTPPEYSAIGCEIEDERCYGVMNYVRLTMPANITVGDTARFVARAGGNSACEAEYFFSFQNYHATNTSGVFDVPVTSAGSFTAVVTAECCSYMKFVTKPVSVASAPGECPKSMDGFSNACGCTTDEPATTFTPSLASVSRQTATEPLGECVAGRVDSANVNIDIDVRCDGGKYRAVLKTLTGKYEFQAGLLPGQQEVTGVESKGNTTKANSYDQIIELQALGFCPGAWYMKQAIVRHEQVHERHLEPSLENIASLIETSIERLTVDATAGKTKLQAIAEIKKLSGYSKVESDATVVWDDEYSTAIRFDHTNGSTAAAEHQVVKPMAESICAYAKMHNWDSHTACQSTTQVFDSQGK